MICLALNSCNDILHEKAFGRKHLSEASSRGMPGQVASVAFVSDAARHRIEASIARRRTASLYPGLPRRVRTRRISAFFFL